MPRFSIIIGVYNQAATLPMVFESLKGQTFNDFEVHFCDDGSDDDSAELIRDFQIDEMDNFPIFIHRQEHKGMRLARNINQGIKAARGEYCVFVMADSFMEQDYLEVLNGWVEENRVICGIRVQVAQVGGKMEGVDMDWRIKKNLIPEFSTVVMGSPWMCLTGNGLTIPTSALRAYGGWWERIEGYGGEDNEIVARLFYAGYLCWSVPDLRLYHHWHKSRDSHYDNQKLVHDKIKEYGS